MRIPPGQIKTVVANVISCLNLSVDVNALRLPGKSCAAYMRRQEMPTISRAHKANELLKEDGWLLNSDGTTLMQQKKVAFLINGIVFGVHDVPDGASQCTLDALKAELAKTSSVAAEAFPGSNQDLKIDHIVSSTSDSASTQTKLTHLLEKETGHEIIENKCAMHLGVNLRAAQVKAATKFTSTDTVLPSSCSVSENSDSDYDESESALICLNRDIDLFVHELTKLFGHLGTPEYCHGSTFRVFLELKARQSSGDDKEYYLSAQKVVLERQVGSRYYVTSCNAGRLYFLCKALVEFLEEEELIKALNRLESTCLKKLHDSLLLTNLKLEGLMFDKVYADLMTLVKSTDLNKTAIEMSSHYKELLDFFGTLIDEPGKLLDPDMQVFKSESLLYGESSKLNHRLWDKYIPVQNRLYENSSDVHESLLLPLVSAVSTAMHSKLQQYMKDYLPGGRYHNPDPSLHSALSKLQPHNDRSESVFGCNDWLSKILPNMAQSTRSTMIEFSLNNTMKWLKEQGEKQKQALVTLAQEQRRTVLHEFREDSKYVFERKLEQRSKAIESARAKFKEKEKKIQAIQSHQLITSVAELDALVANITSLSIPKSLQDAELRELVKLQKLLRTLVFNQKGINLNMSAKGKPRPVSALLKELATVISTKPVRVRRKDQAQAYQQLHVVFKKPSLLKGVRIKHRFEEDGELKWYEGIFTRINKKAAMITYDGDKEEYHFSLEEIKEDFFSGDLFVL